MNTRTPLVRAVDIDPVLFWGAINQKKENGTESYRQIGKRLGITSSTFTRISYAAWDIQPDYRPDLRTYLSLCWWLDRDPKDFVEWPDGQYPGTGGTQNG